MDGPSYVQETRASYDTVAVDYAKLVRPAFESDLLVRPMLGAFAELVRAAGDGPVADVGCGPGHVTAHMHSLGLAAFGVDLSPGMVDAARRDHPGLRFDIGTMTAVYWLPPDRVAELATRTGLTVQATLVRELESNRVPQACLLIRKPVKL